MKTQNQKNQKIPDSELCNIYELYSQGYSQADIALMYSDVSKGINVSQQTIAKKLKRYNKLLEEQSEND